MNQRLASSLAAMHVAVLAGVLAGVLSGCAGSTWRNTPHDVRYQRTPAPILHEFIGEDGFRPGSWDGLMHSTMRPLGQFVNPGTYVQLAIGSDLADDVNQFGQIADSTWFTNRMGRRILSPEDVERGPNTLRGPAEGELVVVSGKFSGNTPGLVVRDTAGNIFVVKFDPPAYPGLASSAEVIATKLLWAAGYNVPENYVDYLELERLRLSPDATTIGQYGATIAMSQAELERVITHANVGPDNRVRALFSRVLPGQLIGPFSYRGTRLDDPNDDIRHEERRSLRGLWVFQAWVNNTATAASNTLDVFIPSARDPEVGYLKHFLIDFGDALGSDGIDPKYVGQGFEHEVDWVEIGKSLFSAGIHYPYWLGARRSPFRSVGVFEADIFDAARWSSDVPNPAFERANALDTYWAASILARFKREHVAAAVSAAEYREDGAARWVRQVLMERRRRLLIHAFDPVFAVDDPEIRYGYTLFMRDLEVDVGLTQATRGRYRFQVRWNISGGEDETLGDGSSDEPIVDLRDVVEKLRTRAEGTLQNQPFITVRWWNGLDEDENPPGVEVHLRVLSDRLLPVALEREVR